MFSKIRPFFKFFSRLFSSYSILATTLLGSATKVNLLLVFVLTSGHLYVI